MPPGQQIHLPRPKCLQGLPVGGTAGRSASAGMRWRSHRLAVEVAPVPLDVLLVKLVSKKGIACVQTAAQRSTPSGRPGDCRCCHVHLPPLSGWLASEQAMAPLVLGLMLCASTLATRRASGEASARGRWPGGVAPETRRARSDPLADFRGIPATDDGFSPALAPCARQGPRVP